MSQQTDRTPARTLWPIVPLAWLFVAIIATAGFAVWISFRIEHTYARWEAEIFVSDAGGWIEDDSADDRSWLGRRVDDRPASTIYIPVGISLEEADRIAGLYPEARIVWLTALSH